MSQDHQYIPNHTVDPATGFMESNGFIYAFDAVKKQQFLDLYKSTHKCKASAVDLGISFHTIQKHYRDDPVFRARFDEVEEEIAQDLQEKSIAMGLTDRGFMDRAMQLRRLRPAQYAPEQKTYSGPQIVINVDGNLLDHAKKREEILDAEIVENKVISHETGQKSP